MANNRRKRNGPDVLISKRDVQLLVHDIGREFSLLVRFEVRFVNDDVQLYAKAYEPEIGVSAVPTAQALTTAPVKSYKPIENLMYTTAWDVYQQLDRERLLKEGNEELPF